MASSDTPAPAVPLDGPRQKFDELMEAYESALWQNARIAGLDSRSVYHEEEEADQATPKAALAAFVSGLLADAALLPLATKARDAWKELAQHANACADCGDTSYDRCDIGVGLRKSAQAADEALSRALPEGGL